MDEGDLTKYVKDSVILLDVVHTVQLVVDSSAGYHLIIIGSMMMMTMMMVMMMLMIMIMIRTMVMTMKMTCNKSEELSSVCENASEAAVGCD